MSAKYPATHSRRPSRESIRTKILLPLTILWLSVATLSQSQEHAPPQLIVPLSDGGFVAFKAEAAFDETRKSSDQQQTRALFDSQALVDDKQIIHRVLVDTEGRPIFG